MICQKHLVLIVFQWWLYSIFWQLYLIELFGLYSSLTRAAALDIYKAFDRVLNAGLLHKLKTGGISSQIFGLISSFLNNRRLRVTLDEKSSQLLLEFLKAPFLDLHFSYYKLMTFLICYLWYCYLCWWYYSQF